MNQVEDIDEEYLIDAVGLSSDSESINEDDLRSVDVFSSSSSSEEIEIGEVSKQTYHNDMPIFSPHN